MKIFYETKRLIVREIEPEDMDAFFELDSDPEVHRYLGNKPVQNKEQSEEMIRSIRQQYIDNGIGRWAIIEKTTGSFVGWTGLKLNKEKANDYVNYYDVGYRLLRKFWGRGIAYESAKPSLQYGFEVLNLETIYAAAHVENIASNKTLAKLGLKFIETFDHHGALHNWYKLERGEWTGTIKPIVQP